MMADPLVALSAREMVRRMRGGSLSALELTAAHLARIEALEPSIRAWAHLDRDGALAAAAQADARLRAGRPLGPLHGLPVAVKDIIDTADMPTEYGARLYAGRRPRRDATIVARLRAAGAIILGKTVTSELALFVPGPTRNPHDLERTPGGSSSGSAAAVAALMAPIALATQTNGSVVRPASFCGVVGYKPSLGVLPRTGILRHSTFLDQPGVIARDVADAAFVVEAIAGGDPEDEAAFEGPFDLLRAAESEGSPPRLGFVRGPYWARADAATRTAIEAFAAGAPTRVETIDLPPAFAAAEETLGLLMNAGIAQSFAADFETARDGFPESVARAIEKGRAVCAVALLDALARREVLRSEFARLAAPYDAILTPASVGVAPLRSQGTGDPIFATVWTLLGAPALSLPLLVGEGGAPLGLQVVGRLRDDDALLRAAAWLMRHSSKAMTELSCAF
jgi:Asp-tRNA(Asn)/Glu-tRNA(Gln) amidotransferase A subunit family amidase